jgi:ElaB/YqjD/DUF883 family membrane-anchored ribosome-binding protein
MERVNGEATGTGRETEEWIRTMEYAVEQGVHEVRSALRAADAWTRELAEERPLVAIGVALAAGYVMARLFARRAS